MNPLRTAVAVFVGGFVAAASLLVAQGINRDALLAAGAAGALAPAGGQLSQESKTEIPDSKCKGGEIILGSLNKEGELKEKEIKDVLPKDRCVEYVSPCKKYEKCNKETGKDCKCYRAECAGKAVSCKDADSESHTPQAQPASAQAQPASATEPPKGPSDVKKAIETLKQRIDAGPPPPLSGNETKVAAAESPNKTDAGGYSSAPPQTSRPSAAETSPVRPYSPPAYEGIKNIAEAPSGNYGPYQGSNGGSMPAPSYVPTGLLNNFTNLNGPSAPPAGGKLGYLLPTAPEQIGDRRFDSVGSQITFPKGKSVDPFASIDKLADKNVLNEKEIDKIIDEVLKKEGIVVETHEPKRGMETLLKNPIVRAGEQVFATVKNVLTSAVSGVSDFFASVFSPVQEQGERETLAERQEAPGSLPESARAGENEKRTKLAIEVGSNVLAAGDPTVVPLEASEGSRSLPSDPFQGPIASAQGGQELQVQYQVAPAHPTSLPQNQGVAGAPKPAANEGSSNAPWARKEFPLVESSGPFSEKGANVVEGVRRSIESVISTLVNVIRNTFLRFVSWF